MPADDGIVFDLTGIEADRIKENGEYEGVRARVPSSLDGARVSMQIDVGFGDKVDPAPAELSFPVLPPLDAPVVRAYPPEAVLAEKFQAMVVLGIANSRMKDFLTSGLSPIQRFYISRLANSLRGTFEQRRTPLPEVPPLALTDEFLLDRAKQTQWNAFCKRLGLRDTPSLAVTGLLLVSFLTPAVERARSRKLDAMAWEPPGPWRKV